LIEHQHVPQLMGLTAATSGIWSRLMTERAATDITAAIALATGLSRASTSAVRAGILIGDARCSTERQDLTTQRETLLALGLWRTGSISITAPPAPAGSALVGRLGV
jgi:hypothetical protein